MKGKLMRVVVIGLLVGVLYSAPTIDGVVDPSEGWSLVGTSGYPNGGGAGANLYELYYASDFDYLYLAITTQNTQSWNVAYGFGLHYTAGGWAGPGYDSWGRYFTFVYPVNWQIYFWWDGWSSSITSWNTNYWNGFSWEYYGYQTGNFAYTGSTNGLQALEMRIAWSDLVGVNVPPQICINTWVAGDGGSSAVDAIPYTTTINDGGGWEWIDQDDVIDGIWVSVPTYVEEKANFEKEIQLRYLGSNRVLLWTTGKTIIQVFDLQGRTVERREIWVNQGEILDFSHLSEGIYLLKVTNSGLTKTLKVIVKNLN